MPGTSEPRSPEISAVLAGPSVEVTDPAVANAQAAGGELVRATFDSPFGRMAELADPFGARSTIVQNTGQPQPDRTG